MGCMVAGQSEPVLDTDIDLVDSAVFHGGGVSIAVTAVHIVFSVGDRTVKRSVL